jgi:DNA modification methylase
LSNSPRSPRADRTKRQSQSDRNAHAATAKVIEAGTKRLNLEIVYASPSALTPYAKNARKHSKRQIAQLKANILEHGFVTAILCDEKGEIIAGHGRLMAAQELGLEKVPVVYLTHLSEIQKKALRIADNRLSELSSFDEILLKDEILSILDEPDFAIETIGFSTGEIDLIVDGPMKPTTKVDPADDIPEPAAEAVSCLGDLWRLGSHWLICGSSRDLEIFHRVTRGEKARTVFTDSPYNVRIGGHVSGLGKHKHREFVEGSGEMSHPEFVEFLRVTHQNMSDCLVDGGIMVSCMDWRHLDALQEASRAVGLTLINLCVWAKTNAGLGSLYRSGHELVLVLKKGKAPHQNLVELGRHGRYRTNVWSYAGANSFKRGRDEELSMHPTVKPVGLVADALRDCAKRGELVVDGFSGSGTTLIAAEKTGRRAAVVELDPIFVDVAIRRWEKLTGKQAVHDETGLTFSQLTAQRATQH